MKRFLLALQFLTIIPLKVRQFTARDLTKSVTYFPLVGLLLGFILAAVHKLLLLLNFAPLSIDIIVIVLLIAFTGGLHLDGLADTSDALLSRKNKEEMLRIMRDSHIGVMGVLALISIILLKIALLSSINITAKTTALLLMCMLSRWTLVWSMFLFPYARQEGKAKLFMQGVNPKTLCCATIITLLMAVFLYKLKGFIILLIIALIAYLINRFIHSKVGGISGDTLGAVNEIMELTVLFGLCLLERTTLPSLCRIFLK